MRYVLSRKLRSQRGASLLLALLFLLICSMVAASILMAAVSNAGKRRSNLTEHQVYLALSSAVSTLCDDLSRAQYTAQYTCWETQEDTGEVDQYENPIYVTVQHFQQETGAYTGYLSDILLADFDAIFAMDNKDSPALTTYEEKKWQASRAFPVVHTLTLTPNADTHLEDRVVDIKLEVQDSYAMYLTATLGDYTIEAELTPIITKLTLPESLAPQGEKITQGVGPMEWKIGWITTGGAATDETTTQEISPTDAEEAAP